MTKNTVFFSVRTWPTYRNAKCLIDNYKAWLLFLFLKKIVWREGRENTVKLNVVELISSQQYMLLLHHITCRKSY